MAINQVGGSSGFVSIALAKKFSQLSFTVQDYQGVIEKGREALIAHNNDLNIEFEAYDFLTRQPVSADVYVLRHICHDWPASEASRIIKNIVPAMKPSSRILLVELVTANPMLLHYSHARAMSVMDLNMMQFFWAAERSREDWEEIVQGTGEKLAILNITRPVGSWDSVIEIGFQ